MLLKCCKINYVSRAILRAVYLFYLGRGSQMQLKCFISFAVASLAYLFASVVQAGTAITLPSYTVSRGNSQQFALAGDGSV